MIPDSLLPNALLFQAESLLAACRASGKKIVTAESCTGGLIAATLTAIAGSSDVVERGYVTYSNAAKHECLGVPMALIDAHGAVSEAVARAMAEGAITHSHADSAISVTGIAGPDGNSLDKPVGLLCFGIAQSGAPARSEQHVFPGDRTAIRAAAVAHALTLIRGVL